MSIKRYPAEKIKGQRERMCFYNKTPGAAVHGQHKSKQCFPHVLETRRVSHYFYLTLIQGTWSCHILKTSLSVSICQRKKRLMFPTCVLLTSFTSPSWGLHFNKRGQEICMLPGGGLDGENQNTCPGSTRCSENDNVS